MAPNLLFKAAFVRGDYNPVSVTETNKSDVRTDFVLENIYAHLLQSEHYFPAISAVNRKELDVLRDLSRIVDDFKLNYSNTLSAMCSDLQVTQDSIRTVVLGVCNEVFCEGITWGRIVALCVFAAELALHALVNGFSEDVVDLIYNCFYQYVNDNLRSWIENHGGWEGVKQLSNGRCEESRKISETQPNSSSSSWAKSVLHGTVRMFGTLARLANVTGEAVSFA